MRGHTYYSNLDGNYLEGHDHTVSRVVRKFPRKSVMMHLSCTCLSSQKILPLLGRWERIRGNIRNSEQQCPVCFSKTPKLLLLHEEDWSYDEEILSIRRNPSWRRISLL